MGSGPVKGFNSQDVQQIITKKHDPTQNKIGKEDAETATFAAGLCLCTINCFGIFALSFDPNIQDVSGESS